MKRKIRYKVSNQEVETYVNYIPLRYTIAIFLTIVEVLAILLSVCVLCYIFPYCSFLAFVLSATYILNL